MIEQDLKGAITSNQLKLEFQPIVDIQTMAISSFETLVRWEHPTLGAIPPAEFVTVAERTAQIKALGEWVTHNALEQFSRLLKAHSSLKNVQLSINFSALQLNTLQPKNDVFNALRKNKIKPSQLVVEITETSLIRNIENCTKILKELEKHGVTLSMDDFGSGYSSLNYLQSLPVKQIKVDKTLINRLTTDKKQQTIVSLIIKTGETLNRTVVAEGVETEKQLTLLKKIGFRYIQGYWFSKPLPLSELLEKLPDPKKPVKVKASKS